MAYIPTFHTPKSILNAPLLIRGSSEYLPFTRFIEFLKDKNYANNTIEQYGQILIKFLNYFTRYIELLNYDIGPDEIKNILQSYPNFLLRGKKSRFKITQQIASDLNHDKNTKRSSLPVIDAAITKFILINEIDGASMIDISDSAFLHITKRIKSKSEIGNILKNSALSGFIRGGIKNNRKQRASALKLPKPKKRNKFYVTKTIEFDQVVKLIESASSYRDKAIYALLAASGARSHEVLQLRLSDIDFKNQQVTLNSPFEFSEDELNLTDDEYSQLAWKGRETTATFLIEPFKSLFFENIAKYLTQERMSLCNHPFLFTNTKTNRPYFCSDRSSRIKMFKKSAKISGIKNLGGISPHSLRHTYATYILNWLPLKGGVYGLPLAYVQKLLGHSSPSSTELYAKIDEELVKAHVAEANEKLFSNGMSFDEIQLEFHKGRIEEIELRLAA